MSLAAEFLKHYKSVGINVCWIRYILGSAVHVFVCHIVENAIVIIAADVVLSFTLIVALVHAVEVSSADTSSTGEGFVVVKLEEVLGC